MVTQAKPNWAVLIRQKRLELGESLAAFGARFGVTRTAVWYWEAGTYAPPAAVTWWLHQEELRSRDAGR